MVFEDRPHRCVCLAQHVVVDEQKHHPSYLGAMTIKVAVRPLTTTSALALLFVGALLFLETESFVLPTPFPASVTPCVASCQSQRTALYAEKKRKRRKRKKTDGPLSPLDDTDGIDTAQQVDGSSGQTLSDEDLARIEEIANYKFDPDAPIAFGGEEMDTTLNI